MNVQDVLRGKGTARHSPTTPKMKDDTIHSGGSDTSCSNVDELANRLDNIISKRKNQQSGLDVCDHKPSTSSRSASSSPPRSPVSGHKSIKCNPDESSTVASTLSSSSSSSSSSKSAEEAKQRGHACKENDKSSKNKGIFRARFKSKSSISIEELLEQMQHLQLAHKKAMLEAQVKLEQRAAAIQNLEKALEMQTKISESLRKENQGLRKRMQQTRPPSSPPSNPGRNSNPRRPSLNLREASNLDRDLKYGGKPPKTDQAVVTRGMKGRSQSLNHVIQQPLDLGSVHMSQNRAQRLSATSPLKTKARSVSPKGSGDIERNKLRQKTKSSRSLSPKLCNNNLDDDDGEPNFKQKRASLGDKAQETNVKTEKTGASLGRQTSKSLSSAPKAAMKDVRRFTLERQSDSSRDLMTKMEETLNRISSTR